MAATCNRKIVTTAVAATVAAAAKAASDPGVALIVPEDMYLREATKGANFLDIHVSATAALLWSISFSDRFSFIYSSHNPFIHSCHAV
jgi:hypothetical protein